jgi:hypothetical protein
MGLPPLGPGQWSDHAVVVDAGMVREEASPASRVAAALAAAGRGWSVIPLHTPRSGVCSCGRASCSAPGKHSRVAWKRRMREEADIGLIERWWRRWPDANLGVVTGAVSGLVVLDVDPRHGGFDSLAVLEAVHGPIGPTVGASTGGGGEHLYFRHPQTFVPCRSIAPGLDVKGDGGLVVCPPSVHLSGHLYRWRPGCAPGEVALAELPWWVRVAAKRSDPTATGARPTRPVPIRTEGEKAEFAELWGLVGIELQPGDHSYLCPFHPDHHPSLHIDAEGCRFYCFGCGRGGGSGRLYRLVGTGASPPTRQAGDLAELPAPCAPSASVTLGGGDDVRVVGDMPHQDALLRLTGGRRHYGGERFECVARLVPEPTNPVDPGAIAVTIGGQVVGHLSRIDAARYSDAISKVLADTGEATCKAVIVGGWERPHGRVGMFGVRLKLGHPEVMAAPDRDVTSRRRS